MNRGLFPLSRRRVLVLLAALSSGCNGLDIRSQSPEDEAVETADHTRLISDCCVPFGMYPLEVQAVGLVTGLPGTGSDPAPSPERGALFNELMKMGIKSPNQLLASNTTDLVLIRGTLRPGIQKGDRFDVEVRVPSRSENTGLRGGWLMQTRLTELAAVGGNVRPGSLQAHAEGPILVDPSAKSAGEAGAVTRARGRILGGGVSEIDRSLGLIIKPEFRNIQTASQTGIAINRRFHIFKQGVKTGVAKPKNDQFIELTLHPRYKDNVERFVRVIRSLPVKESTEEQLVRLGVLERNLLDPISSAGAALKLEAIGKDAIPTLKKGLASPDVEVRFYAAEALAYLDDKSAAAPLGEIAAAHPAFRAFALAALGAMDDFDAYETLRALLPSTSAETRYGAFRALWAMNENDAFIRDAKISADFHYHVIDVDGPPMIHFTRNTRPEIVVFGRDQQFLPPLSVEAGPRILINSIEGGRVSISRFAVGEADQKRVTSMSVDEVVRAVAEMGGTYPDVVQALQQAKAAKSLPGRLEMEAVPKAGRTFDRTPEEATDDEEAGDVARIDDRLPQSDLFPVDVKIVEDPEAGEELEENPGADAENPGTSGGWWSKMRFWD
jgi:flagellar basal body P-ring protein FlgI